MRKQIITVICVLSITFGISSVVYADTNNDSFNSQGRIIFNGPDAINGTNDDIVFDSSDLSVIYNEVDTNRKAIGETLNEYGYTALNPLDLDNLTFEGVRESIDTQFTIPRVSQKLYNDNESGLNLSDGKQIVSKPANGTDTINIDGIEYKKVDEMSAGVTAWNNNGELIIGTGKNDILSYQSGNTEGYNKGYQTGRVDGKTEGFTAGKTQGLEEGYNNGKTDGLTEGYNNGKSDGLVEGYESGRTEGYELGKIDGNTEGYNNGYEAGLAEGALKAQLANVQIVKHTHDLNCQCRGNIIYTRDSVDTIYKECSRCGFNYDHWINTGTYVGDGYWGALEDYRNGRVAGQCSMITHCNLNQGQVMSIVVNGKEYLPN